ncbi:MAG: SH3 domain-containing protein [Deltaproteobacteria bacterium]|nr:MAG: SH3 domain-containing protein [Deltaproteobacteria bacterium]
MQRPWSRSGIIPLFLIALIAASCAPPPVETKPTVYYVTPVITYLKDCPGYDCKVVGQLYRADRVEQLEVQGNWWRVRLDKGTLAGWLQAELLSPTPVEAPYFYVAADSLELRECPSPDCPFRKILLKGDRVQRIAENDQGWLRVLVEKDASLGWVLAAQVSDQAPKPEAKPAAETEYFYTAAATVNLYSLPLFSSKVVKSLPLNEKLEKLAQHGRDWFKVRHPASGAEGWAAAKDLKTSPVAAEPLKPKKKFRRKPAAKPLPQVEEAPLEPEAM